MLEELYLGRLSPYWTKLSSPALDRARKAASREDAYLAARLPKKGRKHLLNLIDACGAVDELTSELEFRRGFSLGARLMIAVFADEDACLRAQP